MVFRLLLVLPRKRQNQNEKNPWKTVFPKGSVVVLLTRPGLEPGITESKSVVLPITLSGYKLVREFRKPIGCRQAVIGVKTESAA